MLKINRKKIHLSLIIILSLFIPFCLFANNKEKSSVSFTIEKVKKRNKAGCNRLGNIYGYCEWVTFVKVTNLSEKPISYFCSNLKINNKSYEICFGKNRAKNIIKANRHKIFLLELNKLIAYPNDNKLPKIKLISHKVSFSN